MKKHRKKLLSLLEAFLVGAFSFLPVKAQERKIIDPFPLPYSTELAIEHDYQELNPLKKTAYLEAKLKEDTSKIYIDKMPGAMCGNYVGQMWINFDGDSTLALTGIPSFDYYDTENGKQNIQTFDVGFSVVGHEAHGVNGFVLKDTLTKIDAFYIYDNSRGKRIYLDSLEKNIDLDYEIDTSKSIIVSHINGFNIAGFPHTEFMLRFNYINGVLTLTEKDPSVVLTNPELDNESSITEYSFRDTITNNPDALVLNYNFHDGEYLETKRYGNENLYYDYDFYSGHFLDSGFFQIDNQDKVNFDFSYMPPIPSVTTSKPIYNQSGEIPLDKSEGNHQVIVNITEYSRNTTKDTINYVIDETPPTTSDDAPATWQNSDFNVTLTPSDALSGVASTEYCISPTDNCTPDTEYTSPISISEEGEKYIRYFSKDKAGNNQPVVSREVKLDETPPEIYITYPEADKDYPKVDSMVVTVSDAHLNSDSCWSSTDNGETKEYFPCSSGEQKTVYPNFVEGANTWTVGAGDYATNTSDAEVNFKIISDTVEDDFKFYPNPVSDIGNFEFSLDKPQNLRFSMYDITGRQLEQRVIEGNAGENKVSFSYDFSKYDSQICIYRIEGDKGYAKTGKVVKK